VASKLYVDNWRWADTPFYVRMGKRLPRRETTIAIQFKRAPHPPFEEVAVEGLRPNVLLIHVQPDEGLSLAIGAKMPGQGMSIRTVHMDFLYGSAFRDGLPEAYERLILDAMLGDATLFTRSDEIEEQWAIVDAIVAGWQRDRAAFPNYAAGTWGPPSADDLLHRDGRSWRRHLMGSVPHVEEWSGAGVSISDIESELARLRAESADEDGHPQQRTSVMTHIAWVPPKWLETAERVLEGLRERHPSRTVILVPRPGEDGGIDARVWVRSFPLGHRSVAGEVIELSSWRRSVAPASIIGLAIRPADLRAGAGEPPSERLRGTSSSFSPPVLSWARPSGVRCVPRSSRVRASGRPCPTSRGPGRGCGARRSPAAGRRLPRRRSRSAARGPRRRCSAAGSPRGWSENCLRRSRRVSSASGSTATRCRRPGTSSSPRATS
jgi:hypothetical protein